MSDRQMIPGAPGWRRGLLVRRADGGLGGEAVGPAGERLLVDVDPPGALGPQVSESEWNSAARHVIEHGPTEPRRNLFASETDLGALQTLLEGCDGLDLPDAEKRARHAVLVEHLRARIDELTPDLIRRIGG